MNDELKVFQFHDFLLHAPCPFLYAWITVPQTFPFGNMFSNFTETM